MIDSYEVLISKYISKEDFFQFGLENTIYIPEEKVKKEWSVLQKTISENRAVFIRGFKESAHMHMALAFYKVLFKHERIKKDPSNTQNPAKIIEKLTGYKKSKDLKNYQLTSVFGRSRNLFAFTAPWNIVYVPSILDPLLSADATSELSIEFKKAFQTYTYNRFKPYIEEFNKIVSNHHFLQEMDDFFSKLYDDGNFDRAEMAKFETQIRNDFEPIKI